MRIIIFCLILFSVTGCNASEVDKIEGFSNTVLQIMRDQDEVSFKKLSVYPNHEISNDSVSYFFGDGNKKGTAVFLKKPNVLYKYYGPYKRNDAGGNNSYSIVYYDAQQIKPNGKGFFNPVEIKKAWGTSYFETVVTVVNGLVMFHRTPFHYGSHAPWEDDY